MKPPPRRRGPPLGDERILLRTNRGDLVLGLYDTVAPKHAAQIRKLVRLGVYDTTTIFRIEPGYLAQIINAQNRQKPLTSAQSKAITAIPAELSKLPHRTGTLSMAHDDDDVNSAETSFSIILGRAPDLDREYTVFGEVEWGQPLLAVLGREKRDYRNKPLVPVVVERAQVKTAAEIERMRTAGELRVASAQPLPALPALPPPPAQPAAPPAPPAPAPR